MASSLWRDKSIYGRTQRERVGDSGSQWVASSHISNSLTPSVAVCAFAPSWRVGKYVISCELQLSNYVFGFIHLLTWRQEFNLGKTWRGAFIVSILLLMTMWTTMNHSDQLYPTHAITTTTGVTSSTQTTERPYMSICTCCAFSLYMMHEHFLYMRLWVSGYSPIYSMISIWHFLYFHQ